MPSDIIVNHPNNKDLQITFKQSNHQYKDNTGKNYISVTTLIHKAFPEFNSEQIAQKCAIKRGVTKQSLLLEWTKKGKEASRVGTRLHQNMQHYILKQYEKMHSPQSIMQKIKFDSAKKIVDNIIKKYHPQNMEVEKLVFSPDFRIAGSIDLLVKINDNQYIIFDWKSLNKDIEKQSYGNKCGNILPTLSIPDCNYYHYALQLKIYQNILKSQNYINPSAKVNRILIVWNRIEIFIRKNARSSLELDAYVLDSKIFKIKEN